MGNTDIQKLNLQEAYEGSYFTLLATGGDPQEWVDGVETLLKQEGIDLPIEWFYTTGKDINAFAKELGHVKAEDLFQNDLSALAFSYSYSTVGKLALFKINFGGRWFDDIVDNMVELLPVAY